MRKLRKLAVSVVIVSLLLFFFGTLISQALTSPFSSIMGGKILTVIPPNPTAGCLFPLLVVGPPRPGIFALVPSSSIYMNFQVFRPGPWVLGTAGPARVCGFPSALNIRIIGTSF